MTERHRPGEREREREREREEKRAGERERERERERDVCVWDLKGTAPGSLGYLFLSKAMRCLEKRSSYVLHSKMRAGGTF